MLNKVFKNKMPFEVIGLFFALLFIETATAVDLGSAYPSTGPFFSANYSTSKPTQTIKSLKVVSFNVMFSKDPDALIKDLSAIPEINDADIILLQEVTGSLGGKENAADTIAKKLGYNYVFSPGMIFGGEDYGNAILSRYPLFDFKKIVLPTTQSPMDRTVRAPIMASVDLNGTFLKVVNTHLSVWFSDSTGKDVKRSEQMKTMLTDFKLSEYPNVLIGGDLNTHRQKGEDIIKNILKGEQYQDAHPVKGWTFRTFRTHLDHIFIKGIFEPGENGNSTESRSSDHIPIWAKISTATALVKSDR